ncbi:MAG: exodeoxyribonuclease III [Gammaproteobacteria bacterium]|nr:exodeoxyribonuclease III [Gammaproteobacteria bacterium]MDH5802129.1 exodeoxyribonuclease III [Gammaproteobacteria bacterium]
MKIVSVNVNGIRAAHRKGFFQWLEREKPDIVCIQETKAQEHQLHPEDYYPKDYHCYYFDAQKKGYSGVAIYSREKPKKVTCGLGQGWEDMDAEGRYIQADFDKFSVISLYLPSGSSSEERQQIKFDFLDRFVPHLQSLRRKKREFVICGDWNIAHKKVDIKNWRGNQKNSGFLPEEREWMDQLFGKLGYVDGFRVANQEEDQYTWWSNRGQAWAKNVGWRIDYQVITPGLKDKVKSTHIYKDERFSDHAPLILNYQI